MNVKNAIASALVLACTAGIFLAKGLTAEGAQEDFQVLTTIYPTYDWINTVLGDNPAGIKVGYLLDSGADLHSFQPTVDDMMEIASSELFVYVGGESDTWVKDALSSTRSEDLHTLCLLDVLGENALQEEVVEGMQAEEEEEEEEDGARDEHIWLSLKNASRCVDAIRDELMALDEENAELYAANAAAFQEKLADLDARYAKALSEAPRDTLLFGDRFPFLYLTRDYGLNYYAAFLGCSAETEASFETIIFLAQKIDELGLPCILTIEGSDQKVAETIRKSTREGSQEILSLDSMQAASSAGKGGYLAIMEENLDTLIQALQ